ncbi:GNAT family N-acetyltransferase [Mariniluteicoccus flavus]
MTDPVTHQTLPELPEPWVARRPELGDVDAVIALLGAYRRSIRGEHAAVDHGTVASQVAGPGSWTRRQLVVTDGDRIVAWAWAHDRAAGRTNVDMIVDPTVPGSAPLAPALLAWVRQAALALSADRGLSGTTLDFVTFADDPRQRAWLTAAGFTLARTWLEMERPVTPDEAESLPKPRDGVRLRQVRKHADGTPEATDLQTVHRMLEESFADHFNSYRESFPEFVTRMREDAGHRWDHWWLAEFDDDGTWFPGGALVSTVVPPDASGKWGSYVDYIGVHRSGRGRGIAKALLYAVVADAAERGRGRVDLEVDADSPTGADGLYRSLGWEVDHRTESWHASAGEASLDPKEDFTS